MAFPLIIAESELEFFFGDNSILLDRNPNNLGLPLLNQEGFLGRRFIIDDYFKAGEDLMAGDAVGINPVSESDDDPTLFRMDSGTAPHSLIGIVHTPWSKSVGDLVTSVTDFVPVVVQGIAKARASLDVGVGDSVTPEIPSEVPLDDSLSRVKKATTQIDPIVGRCVSTEPVNEESENRVIDLLVDITGAAFAPPRG